MLTCEYNRNARFIYGFFSVSLNAAFPCGIMALQRG